MRTKQVLTLLFSLSTIVYHVTGDCSLDAKYIKTSNRLFLLKDDNGNYELLLRDSVPNRRKLYLVCDESQIDVVECDAAGNFLLNLPTSPCKRPSAVVKQINAAVPDPNYKMYSVGFNVGRSFVELYRTVYSVSRIAAMYSVYKSYTDNIVTSRPQQTFTTDRIINGSDAASFTQSSVFDYFNATFGDDQIYVNNSKESVIQRGHLAPSADFLFDSDMRATFKYINVVPQFGSINRANWGSIEAWARRSTGSGHAPYLVLTGGYDVLTLRHPTDNAMIPVYLLDGNKNPVPKWMYKIVQKLNGCTVFITYNNIYDNLMPTTICNPIPCPINLDNTDKEKGYTYCCDVNEFKRNVIPTVNFC